MIITDPAKRPKERFTEVIQGYFFAKGYAYKKSLNQFARVVDMKKEMVSIWYNKTGNLVLRMMITAKNSGIKCRNILKIAVVFLENNDINHFIVA